MSFRAAAIMEKLRGDINAGGIAGIMNTEYDVDPEVDMDLTELTDVEVRSTTNDVLIHCINYGTVAGKKEKQRRYCRKRRAGADPYMRKLWNGSAGSRQRSRWYRRIFCQPGQSELRPV